jgi:hypothetical protein
MYVFDASSIIHAWDTYPIAQFPPLWNWMAERIKTGQFAIPRVALQETQKKWPDCGKWLREAEIAVLDLDAGILNEALRIKHLLDIVEDAYHPKGVGENDILIIATVKIACGTLVSDEAKQFRLPDVRAKFKIPAVCGLPEVAVPCMAFITLIKQSGAVFA